MSDMTAKSQYLTLDELLAREEIADVIKRLARGTDRLNENMIVSCYHSDATDEHNVFRGSGREFAQWVTETLLQFEATMHFVGSPNIRINGHIAQVDTYCVAHHITSPDVEGNQSDLILGLRYVDRFERRDGCWLIARRTCAFDWSYTVPFGRSQAFLFEEGWTVGRRDQADIMYSDV